MLLLNDGKEEKQITPADLIEILGIKPEILKKIEKSPVFVINPGKTKPDKLNGGVTAPAGKASKPYIHFKINGITHTIRYATSAIPDKVNPRITSYAPKRILFEDQTKIYPEIEEALMIYILPCCKNSPIADTNWHYSFEDKEADAMEVTDRAAKIGKALNMINGSLSNEDILLIAKGIYAQNSGPQAKVIPNPSAKNKSIAEVKADLTKLALNDPDFFLNNADSDINQFYGLILDAVDRGIVKVRIGQHSSRSWYWEEGPLKNELIADIKPGQTDFDVLRGTIEANPNKYYDAVIKAVQQVSGKESLAQHIAKTKADATRNVDASIKPGDDEFSKEFTGPKKTESSFVVPTSFDESNVLLASFNDGKKANPKHNGKFWSGHVKPIYKGELKVENAEAYLTEKGKEILAEALV